jgi:two-component system OmpR family sensor kinase
MHLGLRRRLLLLVTLAVAVAICALVAAFNLLLDGALMHDANALVRTRASAELTTLQLSGRGVREAEAPDDASPATGIWVFTRGRPVEAPRAGRSIQEAARAAASHPFRYSDVPAADLRLYALPAVYRGRRVGTVVAATSLAPYEESRRTALIGSLVFGGIVLALVAAAAWWLLSHALRPVVRMTRQAAAWSERDLDKRFALGEPTDELTELGATLDGLLDRLATTLRHEQRFSAELSHELRTPLARMIGEAELALRRERPTADYRAALEVVRRNAEQLARTIDALVAAARHELGATTGSADAAEVAAEAIEACSAVANERTLQVSLDELARPIRLGLDHDLAERIVQPVVENACRYGRSSVRVSIAQSDGTVAFLVEDDGPGVGAGERETIFEPGRRGGAGDGTAGAGLGLALARRLARSVAGDVEALEAAGRGRFRITLPRA